MLNDILEFLLCINFCVGPSSYLMCTVPLYHADTDLSVPLEACFLVLFLIFNLKGASGAMDDVSDYGSECLFNLFKLKTKTVHLFLLPFIPCLLQSPVCSLYL